MIAERENKNPYPDAGEESQRNDSLRVPRYPEIQMEEFTYESGCDRPFGRSELFL